MRRLFLLVLALLLFVGAVLAMLPASTLLALLPASLSLRLEDVRGSVWNGSAQRAWMANRPIGALTWQVHPQALFRGVVAADVQALGELTGDARFQRSWSRWQLQRVNATLPASVLTPILASPGLQPQGRLSVHIAHAELQDNRLIGLDGELVWHDAAVSGAASAALGRLTATFQQAGAGAVYGKVTDAGGPLALAGDFVVDGNGYQARFELRARDPRIAPALVWLGQPQADGSRHLLLKGALLLPGFLRLQESPLVHDSMDGEGRAASGTAAEASTP